MPYHFATLERLDKCTFVGEHNGVLRQVQHILFTPRFDIDVCGESAFHALISLLERYLYFVTDDALGIGLCWVDIKYFSLECLAWECVERHLDPISYCQFAHI